MSLLTNTKQFLLHLLLFVVYLMAFRTAPAQLINDPPLTFESIGYKQITGAMVVFFKDSKGFMWFLLDGSINRYDGNEFKIFRSNASDSITISSGLPLAIAEDRNGIIWMTCDIPHGLNSYNPATGKFTRYSDQPVFKNKLPSVQILSLFVDNSNTLWMCAAGDGVYCWDQKTNIIDHFKHDPRDTTSITDDNILGGVVLPDSNILFYSAKNIDLFNKKTSRFTKYEPKLKSKLSLTNWKPGIFCDFSGNICIPSDEGLNIVSAAHSLLIDYPVGLKEILKKNTTKYILILPDKKIWINSDSGLFALNPVTKNYSVYRNDPYNPNSIARLQHQELTYDNSGVIWIKGGGINKVNLENEKFHIVNNPDEHNMLGGPVHSAVRRSFQDMSGNIYQTNPWGVYLFDFASNKFNAFLPDKSANKYLKKKDIRFVFKDREGSYWFGVDNTKILLYEPKSRSWKTCVFDENDYYSYPGDYNMQAVLQDDAGNIWFAGEFSVYKYDKRDKKFKKYMVDSTNRKNRMNSFEAIFSTDDGNIWFGGIGLLLYNSKADRIEPVVFSKNEAARILSNSRILYVLKADSLRMWIGTDGNGMFLLDLRTGNCKRISTADGLPNDRIFAISKDFRGTLWVSTDGGLCKYNPAENLFNNKVTGSFKTYDANYTWPVQGFEGPDSTMYFKMFAHPGLLHFHPDSIPNNTFIPPVYITEFRLFNKPVRVGDSTQVLDSTIETKRKIILNHDQNAILFTFAALSFIHPENNQYAYMLEGFDKGWIYTDASRRFASYTNLDPGEYTFKVKASNNDGVWNEKPATLRIIITPAWWQTWWFKVLTVSVLAGIIYGIYRYRLQQVIKTQRIRNNIASDLHDDVGSTLSSISYYTAAIKKQVQETNPEAVQMLDKMESASADSVNAMSDIVWTTNPAYDKGADLLNRMQSYASEICAVKNIQLEFESDKSFENAKINMNIRKNIFLIFKEAVNNAVKYSGCTRLSVYLSQNKMQIKDNGKGFDTQSEFGGNGLKNMRHRASEIKANIEIISRQGEGCCLTLKW